MTKAEEKHETEVTNDFVFNRQDYNSKTMVYSILKKTKTSGANEASASESMQERLVPMNWLEFADFLADSEAFRDGLICCLRDVEFKAYFWEFNPVASYRAASTPVHFAILESSELAQAKQNSGPFRKYIDSAMASKELTTWFLNLGRDAELIIPVPPESTFETNFEVIPTNCYAHIASFMCGATSHQTHALLIALAARLQYKFEDPEEEPFWVSTSG